MTAIAAKRSSSLLGKTEARAKSRDQGECADSSIWPGSMNGVSPMETITPVNILPLYPKKKGQHKRLSQAARGVAATVRRTAV